MLVGFTPVSQLSQNEKQEARIKAAVLSENSSNMILSTGKVVAASDVRQLREQATGPKQNLFG